MLSEPINPAGGAQSGRHKELKEQFTIHASVAAASSVVTGAFIYAALANEWGVGLIAATLIPAAFAARYIWAAVRSARELSWDRAAADHTGSEGERNGGA